MQIRGYNSWNWTRHAEVFMLIIWIISLALSVYHLPHAIAYKLSIFFPRNRQEEKTEAT